MNWHHHSTTKTDKTVFSATFIFYYIFAYLLEAWGIVFHCQISESICITAYSTQSQNSAMAEEETAMSSIFCLFFTVWAPWSECWENGSDVSGVCELVAVAVCLPSQQMKSNNTSARTDKLPRINVSIYLRKSRRKAYMLTTC